MVIDTVTYNGEKELFEIRYNILKDFVDEFVVVEFDKTFSGKPKEPLFDSKWDKVSYYYITEEQWSKYLEMAKQSPNTMGAEHWKTEFAQKESIKDCLTHLEEDDVVFIGDVDEVWNPILAFSSPRKTHKLGLQVYTYYLNNLSTEKFFGTIFTKYKFVKNKCLNHIRSQTAYFEYLPNAGWHFTSLKDSLRKKLEDSYTKETYANEWVVGNLNENVANNKDFLGRDFTYTIDESGWPQYLKDNREKYKHLLKE